MSANLSFSPSNLNVYKSIVGLIWRHGNHDLLVAAGFNRPSDKESNPPDGPQPTLAEDLEKLGPTYVKIGQVLSTQIGVLPPEYMQTLARLQDDVEPMPFPDLLPVLESGIGAPYRSVFKTFDTVPIGSASLGQVHRAVLLNGQEVAVKLQRPDAQEKIARDFDGLQHVAQTIDGFTQTRYNLSAILKHTRWQIEQELDYTHEASNLETMRQMMADEPRIRVPKPIMAFSSERVLVMEFFHGDKISGLSPRRIDAIDGERLAERVFKKYLDHILVDGFYHADPHPGNVLIDDNNNLLLLDLGMVGRLAPGFRERLTQMVLAIVDGRGEDVAEVAIKLGQAGPDYNRDDFIRAISQLVLVSYNRSIQRLNIGGVVLQIARICGEHHLRIPPELSTMGRALLHLDDLGQTLAPGFNPARTVRKHTLHLLWRDFWRSLSPMAFFGEAIEIKRLCQNLPGRVDTILTQLASQDYGFRINAIDEDRLIHGFEKIANRITYGLIIAALFIAGAMVMNSDNAPWPVAGVSVLAWLMFAAGAAGIVMVLSGILMFRKK